MKIAFEILTRETLDKIKDAQEGSSLRPICKQRRSAQQNGGAGSEVQYRAGEYPEQQGADG